MSPPFPCPQASGHFWHLCLPDIGESLAPSILYWPGSNDSDRSRSCDARRLPHPSALGLLLELPSCSWSGNFCQVPLSIELFPQSSSSAIPFAVLHFPPWQPMLLGCAPSLLSLGQRQLHCWRTLFPEQGPRHLLPLLGPRLADRLGSAPHFNRCRRAAPDPCSLTLATFSPNLMP